MCIKDYSDCSIKHSLLWKNCVNRDFLGFSFCDPWEAMRFRLSVKFEGRGDGHGRMSKNKNDQGSFQGLSLKS